ncbi:MAG: hypothetical protein WAV51_00290 [Microgenomates group bacterium]
MKKLLFVVLVFVLLSLTACSGIAANTAPTATEATATLTLAPTELVVPSATPTLEPAATEALVPTATFEPSIAGGDFLAIRVDTLDDGWQRIVTAGNRDNCAWSNQFKLEMSTGVDAQVPHCWELRMTGTGTVKFEVKPDDIGYATSDTLSTGLAFWPSGTNGSYRVTRDGVSTDWIPLTTGPEGVNFPKDSTAIIIEFKLDNGYMAMPLGEIRNNVLPQY